MVTHLEREGFASVTKVNDALSKFLEALGAPRVKVERVSLENASGRFLANDVTATAHIPPTDRSVVDGYAIRSDDAREASESNPAVFDIIGESRIGEVCRTSVTNGKGVAVATGSMIPSGADTVVMAERTKPLQGGRFEVHVPVHPGQDISKKGEDVSPGILVLKHGRRLRAQDIGILKSMGIETVQVVRKPRIAILSTGNELVTSSTRQAGKIVDINRPILSAMVREFGAEPVDLGIAKDQEQVIVPKMRKGLRSSDALVVSAGSSVGKQDLVPKCINSLGKPGMLVHGIAMRPAMPTGLAVINGKPVLSLPGFPVSAMLAFRVFGRPLVALLMGVEDEGEPVVKASLKERVGGAPGYRTFVRVTVRKTTEGFVAEPLKLQRSSVLMSMVTANGIVAIPEDGASFEAGQTVDVSLIGEIAS